MEPRIKMTFEVNIWYEYSLWPYLRCVPENVTILSCYNSDIHEPILVISGRIAAQKVNNQNVCFHTSPKIKHLLIAYFLSS